MNGTEVAESDDHPKVYWSGEKQTRGDTPNSGSPPSRGRTFSDWGIEFRGSALPMDNSELIRSTESPSGVGRKQDVSADLEDPPLTSGDGTVPTTADSTLIASRRNQSPRPRAFSTELVESL
ncbi:hypothetical protein Pmar_PMAR022231 [Perkinsus marinus ATCC 50983]|uniref:Uncharacterized protein n=1 Tax=Perkinsus marinus (strain ATCC 50983 / TXsc) TaxID=423536 RepID=C5LQD7_PERM5|nr:hypothetical protein Pmar_PMAR022231 [Perkinsus marinus ATCC 50983]EER01056.1 hypothetical protein Pmar_PMAR022231 [Perkinsus marinus ATCC 50983]|eukprot:XP_002768338.1 hypothetical protein Pmar_PMAR022231 [Perkinsus marinus ATCC 50983]